MRASRTIPLILLSTAVLTSGLVAPSMSQALAPAWDVSASEPTLPTRAFLRVDGGTAYAKELGKHRYVVRAPQTTQVRWMGEAKGRKDQVGFFSPTRVTKVWTRLGHRADVGAQSLITWQASGDDVMSFVDARVSDPRINAKGELVFTVRVRTGALPKALPDFSINVNPEGASPRGYNLTWPVSQIMTNSFGFTVTATADQAAQVVFQYYSGGRWTTCPNPSTFKVSLPNAGRVSDAGVVCNGVRIGYDNSSAVTLSLMPMSSVAVCYYIQLNVNSPYGKSCWGQSFSWQPGGTSPSPSL